MISIVMSVWNRQGLLDGTMASIKQSSVKDFELIVVDDASDTPVVCPRADKIIRIEKKDKWWYNPCIPYNIGFREATGDVVVIQCPECYHVGDILATVRDNIKSGTYLSFACYAINLVETARFHNGIMPTIGNYVFSANSKKKTEYNGWFNHSKHRPMAYHFCSAITKDDLNTLGGFDERYAMGIAYDDDELIRRIRRTMDVKIIDEPFVIHQYHPHMSYAYPNMRQLHERNKQLYQHDT